MTSLIHTSTFCQTLIHNNQTFICYLYPIPMSRRFSLRWPKRGTDLRKSGMWNLANYYYYYYTNKETARLKIQLQYKVQTN